ncbi:hypothetical protein [Aquisalimonas sp.]|uniref:hypothetical protein n=1 Tax=Aquisalimonas sp. TaxID=1872621 RepID=UPI0025B83825|nr:hypothetical protein [Aquisalimonas sp.]
MAQRQRAAGNSTPAPLPRWARWTTALGIIGASAFFIMALLPDEGLSTDLSQVGQGKPVAVLTFETAHPASMSVMDRIAEFRSEGGDEIDFLVADLGTPDGDAFARRHGAPGPGVLIFFDAAGQRQRSLDVPQSSEEIGRVAESVTRAAY